MISKNIKLPSIKSLLRLHDVDKAHAKAMRAVMTAYPPLENSGGNHHFDEDIKYNVRYVRCRII